MSQTAEVLLGVIAVAVAVMALVQVGVIVAGLRVARRVEQVARDLETGVKPLIANLTTLTAEASRAASLSAVQVERVDRLFSDLAARADKTMTAAQRLITGPATNGMAVVAGIRAAMTALQTFRGGSRRRATRAASLEEEEESLFIG